MPTLLVLGQSIDLAALIALSCGVGLVAGMFGVGGGFLLVPLMHVLLGVPLPVAVGAGLCQTIATSLGSLLRYRDMGRAESRFDVLLLGGSLLGVDAGTRLLEALDGMGSVALAGAEVPTLRLVVTIFYLLLFCSMAALLWWKQGPTSEEEGPGPLARVRAGPSVLLPGPGYRVSAILVAFLGLANGLLAGLLGIGGGIVLVPLMLYGFGFEIRRVAGTGLVVVLVVALLGTVQHARLGNVHLGLAMTLMVGSAIAAQIGATLTRTLPATALRRGLALVLLLTNAALLAKLVA